ncbi:Ribonuclease Z [Candidatus Calditenuaceae archaeon HR02]|nr:Ribonuclease Z [Candidatus Calditenuaceae archaeon HR02]
MRLIVLGAGSIVPTPYRFGSGHYVEAGEIKLLLDCGPGVLEKMRSLSLSPFKLTAVLLTHFHIDHVSDIFPLLKLRAFTPEGLPNRSPDELRIFGPRGLKRFLGTLIDNNEFFSYVKTLMRYESYTSLEEVEPWGVYEFGGVRLTSAPAKHDGGVAYRIDFGGVSLVYSGDTAYSEDLVKLAKGVDVLVHECSFPHERIVGQHVSEVELARIVAQVRPETVVVTHLYPIWEGEEHKLVSTLEQSYRCRVVVARNGTELTI